MKQIVICAGGPQDELVNLQSYIDENTAFIGVDRGALHLLEEEIVPIEAVGDFDSVTEEEYDMIASRVQKIGKFAEAKNETDTELAVERALAYKPESIVFVGVTGGRLDHLQSALHLLYRYQVTYPSISFSIRNKTNELVILLPKVHRLQKKNELPYVSFFSFGQEEITGMTLTGFEYETVNATLQTGTTRFTSNELRAEVCTISFREGICLMVRSSDS